VSGSPTTATGFGAGGAGALGNTTAGSAGTTGAVFIDWTL